MPTLSIRHVDFLGWRIRAVLLSLAIVAAGLAVTLVRGVPLGIDFSGGTLIVVEFDRDGVGEGDVRRALTPLAVDRVVQQYGPAADRRMLIRVGPDPTAAEESLDAASDRVTAALGEGGLPPFEIADRALVSPAVGEDLRRQAVWATVAAMAAVAGFIAIRYRPSFAAGAMVAVLHDVLVTLACVALAGYDLSLTVVAGLLTTIGYSVNDTIVIYDRIRENMALRPRAPLADVVNPSIGDTLPRTMITSGTTALAVLSLFTFGGEPLRAFAFTMLAGLVSGTWSSIFIAPGAAVLLNRRGPSRPAVPPRVPPTGME